MTASNETYRVLYRTDASAHYVDLGKQNVEIARREAMIELNGEQVRCVIEDAERAEGDYQKLYLRRKPQKKARG